MLEPGSTLERDGETLPLSGFFDVEFVELSVDVAIYRMTQVHWQAGDELYGAVAPVSPRTNPPGTAEGPGNNGLGLALADHHSASFTFSLEPELLLANAEFYRWRQPTFFNRLRLDSVWMGTDPLRPEGIFLDLQLREGVLDMFAEDVVLVSSDIVAYATIVASVPEASPRALVLLALLTAGVWARSGRAARIRQPCSST